MNRFLILLACAALASAGGIPQYSISEVQPDRAISINRGVSLGSPLYGGSLLSSSLLGGSWLGAKSWGAPLASPYGLSSRSIIAEPALLSGPLLSTKGLGAPLVSSYGLSSRSIIAEPTLLSAPYLSTKTLGAPLAYAAPSRTIITRSDPYLTRWASPSVLSSPYLSGKTLGAPLAYAAPTATIIRSEPIITGYTSSKIIGEPLLGSAYGLASAPLLSKSIISEPALLSAEPLGLGVYGTKTWLKK